MKHYQQNGMNLKRTYLHESGNVCDCCEDFSHGGYDESDPTRMLHDDTVCPKCQSLCSCSCHREEARS